MIRVVSKANLEPLLRVFILASPKPYSFFTCTLSESLRTMRDEIAKLSANHIHESNTSTTAIQNHAANTARRKNNGERDDGHRHVLVAQSAATLATSRSAPRAHSQTAHHFPITDLAAPPASKRRPLPLPSESPTTLYHAPPNSLAAPDNAPRIRSPSAPPPLH